MNRALALRAVLVFYLHFRAKAHWKRVLSKFFSFFIAKSKCMSHFPPRAWVYNSFQAQKPSLAVIKKLFNSKVKSQILVFFFFERAESGTKQN